jgi:hypothetical protein
MIGIARRMRKARKIERLRRVRRVRRVRTMRTMKKTMRVGKMRVRKMMTRATERTGVHKTQKNISEATVPERPSDSDGWIHVKLPLPSPRPTPNPPSAPDHTSVILSQHTLQHLFSLLSQISLFLPRRIYSMGL